MPPVGTAGSTTPGIGADGRIGEVAGLGAEAEAALFDSAIDTMKNEVNNRLIKDQLSQIKSDVQNLSY